MPNQTMQNLLSQYTGLIRPDDRVFSQDVLSYDTFARPFKEWIGQTLQQNYLPEFLRTQYNPAIRNTTESLHNLNQNIGLSGGWRNRNTGVQMNNAAEDAILQEEGLRTGYNNDVLNTTNQFLQQWVDPLYKSRMTNFYEAPFRNLNTGAVTPTTTTSNPQLQMPASSNVGTGTTSPGIPGATPSNNFGLGNTNPRSLYSQYLRKP